MTTRRDDRPDYMTTEQLAAQPMGSIVYTRTGQFCRTTADYASWQLAQEGVSL